MCLPLFFLLVWQCIFQAGSFRGINPPAGSFHGKAKEVMSYAHQVLSAGNAPSEANDILCLNRRVQYSMASEDLSSIWLELVQTEKVAVTTFIPDDSKTTSIGVRYGVRMHPLASDSFMEFVEPADKETEAVNIHPKIAAMNETLRKAAQLLPSDENEAEKESSLQCRYDGKFVAQLQLVRTLRPPPSPGFGQTGKTSSAPPPYIAETDSFVTGDLRLQLRPRVATLNLPSLSTPWDIYHNISPADVRGHFLLLPTIENPTNNWRGQALTASDCHDLVHLTASVQPLGSLLTCFNSVGAGASQNHIHCHLWPAPPVPWIYKQKQPTECQEEDCDDDSHDHSHSHSHMIDDDENYDDTATTYNGWDCYAACRVESIYDFVDVVGRNTQDPLVEVSYLNYPCFCVQLSTNEPSLDALGKAVWEVLCCLNDAPYNVCMINRPSYVDEDDDDDGAPTTGTTTTVDVFVFARSRERSPDIVPATKAGASEMMGVFHCQNLEQLEELARKGNNKSPMAQLLEDVSHENPAELWETIKERIESMEIE